MSLAWVGLECLVSREFLTFSRLSMVWTPQIYKFTSFTNLSTINLYIKGFFECDKMFVLFVTPHYIMMTWCGQQ